MACVSRMPTVRNGAGRVAPEIPEVAAGGRGSRRGVGFEEALAEGFGLKDRECRLAGECEQILVAADEGIGLADGGEDQEVLVVGIAADGGRSGFDQPFKGFAARQVVGKRFLLFAGGETEFRLGENGQPLFRGWA